MLLSALGRAADASLYATMTSAPAATERQTAGARGSSVAYVLLTLGSLAFAGTWVAGKVAVAAIPPLVIAVCRFAIAALMIWVWARIRRVPGRRLTVADLPMILALGATAPVGGTVTQLYGLRLAPASDGAIIMPGLGPILTAVLAWPMLGERVNGRVLAGLITALVGLALVVEPAHATAPGRLLGDALFLVGALCWTFYGFLGKVATQQFNPVAATLYATASAACLFIPMSVVGGGWGTLTAASPTEAASVLYLAIFGTAVGFVFFYEGVSRIGAVRAGAFASLIPVFGVALSVVFLGERLSLLTFAGGALVLVGLWFVQHRSVIR
jgi:drug/metabolite transporter (DMT)-like permease